MCTRLLAVALFGWSCNGDKDDSASADGDVDTDTDSDADTDTDSDTDTDLFFDAKGTFDGKPFDVECPPDVMIAARQDLSSMSVVVASCAAVDSGFMVLLGAADPRVDDYTECSPSAAVEVGTVDGSKAWYSCLKGGVDTFEMRITEVDETASSTVWAGTFSMSGNDGTHSAEVSGSFRVESVLSN